MIKRILILAVLILPCSAFAGPNNYYLKMEPIKGESKRADHEDEIDVRAWSWKSSFDGRVNCIEDLKIIKQVDLSSPDLLMGQARGTVYPIAILSTRRDSGDTHFDFLVIRLADVRITSVSTDDTGGDDGLVETVSLRFSRASYEYTVQNDDGSEGGINTADIIPGVSCR